MAMTMAMDMDMVNITVEDHRNARSRSMRRRIGSGLAVGVASVVVMAFTLASVQTGQSALRWWPTMASANAEAASNFLEAGSADPSSVAQGKAKAITALRFSAIDVKAVRSLGLAAALENNGTKAIQAFGYALGLSRRDVPTQMWFIERAVERDDIDGALRHYDQAMTTSVASRQTLIPILVQATTTPAIADRLILMLRRKPNWWGDFTHQLIGTTPDAASLYQFAIGLGLRSTDTEHPDFLPRIVQRLVAAGDVEKAFELYRINGGMRGATVRNGDFEQADVLPPIDWQYVEEPDLTGQRQGRPDGKGTAMFLVARAGRGGSVAEQLLRLSPGQYRIGMTIGDMPGGNAAERTRVMLRCEGSDRQPISSITLPAAPVGGRRFEATFVLPAGSCQVQRLSIVAAGALVQVEDTAPWIDDIAIVVSRQ